MPNNIFSAKTCLYSSKRHRFWQGCIGIWKSSLTQQLIMCAMYSFSLDVGQQKQGDVTWTTTQRPHLQKEWSYSTGAPAQYDQDHCFFFFLHSRKVLFYLNEQHGLQVDCNWRVNNAQHDTDFVLTLPNILEHRQLVTWSKSSYTPSYKMEIFWMGENHGKLCQICKKDFLLTKWFNKTPKFPFKISKNTSL